MNDCEKIERRSWTLEEKKRILNSCGSKCACCSKKLNLKTMTMDHVIPISKGGENVEDNLVALCESCNQDKSNEFYWPRGYYMALESASKGIKINNYVKSWVETHIDIDDVKEFPLIAKAAAININTSGSLAFKTYCPQFMVDAIELDFVSIKRFMKELDFSKSDYLDTIINESDLYSLIGVQSRLNKKCLSVYSIQYVDGVIVLSEVKSINSKYSHCVPQVVLNALVPIYESLGINITNIRTRERKTIDELLMMLHRRKLYINTDGSYMDKVDYGNADKEWFCVDNTLAFKTGKKFPFIVPAKEDTKDTSALDKMFNIATT